MIMISIGGDRVDSDRDFFVEIGEVPDFHIGFHVQNTNYGIT